MAVRSLGTSAEVANYLRKTEKTLRNWRHLGLGPKWHRVGRDPMYRWDDVERWIDEQEQGGGEAA